MRSKIVSVAIGSKSDILAIKKAIEISAIYEKRILVLYFLNKSTKKELSEMLHGTSTETEIEHIKRYQKLCDEVKDCEDVYIKTDIFSGTIKDLVRYLEELNTRIVVISDILSEKEKTNNHKYNQDAYDIAKKAYCPVVCVRSEING